MLKKCIRQVYWAVAFAAIAALFFHAAFHFDVWYAGHWNMISRMRIRGLSGLAFGMSMIAAVPLYLACSRNLWKTGSLPFIKKKKKSEPKIALPDDAAADKIVLPEDLPDEMHTPFIRLLTRGGIRPASEFLKVREADDFTPAAAAPEPKDTAQTFMPLPDSFDATEPAAADSVPTFKDVDF